MPGMRNKILLTFAAASSLVVLGACGSSTSTASTATPVAATTANSTTANASSTDSTTAGSGASVGSTPASGAGAGIRAGLQEWEVCLTKNGVTLPSTALGGFPGNGTGSRPPRSLPANGSVPPGADSSTPVSGGRRNGGSGALATINSFLAEPANSVAAAACKSLQPTFGGAGANPANRAAYQAYLSCLASNGVTVPTIDTTQTSQPQSRQTVNTADPNFAAANAKCSVLLPQNTNGSGAPQTGAGAGSTATTGA